MYNNLVYKLHEIECDAIYNGTPAAGRRRLTKYTSCRKMAAAANNRGNMT